jgi:acyl-CoA reductase-like NAD-dependent aldehyde dehydrogenase
MGGRQQTISPVDGSVYAEFELASADVIDRMLDAATAAQPRWKAVPIDERATTCRRAVQLMVDAADAIGTELTWQMGRPVAQSPFEIRRGFQERAKYMIDIAGGALADIALEPKQSFERFIRREPLGVVLVLAPWNYPYLASVNAVIPALMAGNSVILKVSQQTPLVAERYAAAFREAGLPEGVFQHLQASYADVDRMIGDGRINFV